MKNIYILIVTGLLVNTFNLNAQMNVVNVCAGEQVCLVAGTYQGSIQWQNSDDLIAWTNIALGTTDTFCFSAISNNYYRASITNGTCDPVFSDTTHLIVSGGAGSAIDTFFFTGAYQQYIVPLCVDSVTIVCYGAQGGDVTGQPPFPVGAFGAMMSGKFNVTGGQVLTIVVGGKGNNDPSSAGGGGASGVADGITPFIIAGGGAGFDFQDPAYPNAIGNITTTGSNGNGGSSGVGGSSGADGGDHAYTPTEISRGGRGWGAGTTGSLGLDGTSANTTFTLGTFGLGGGGGSVGYGWCNCGGGGGGYSGGGSGDINNSGGGGGSYNIGTGQNNIAGEHAGSGMVIISY